MADQCKATTNSGTRCQNSAQEGSDYCYVKSHCADKKGYDRGNLISIALDAIKEHGLVFQSDVIAYLPCSKTTFYALNLNESDKLKKELYDNRVAQKVKMRKKWLESDNASLQIALMKLISDDSERRRMAMEYRDHTSDGEKIFEGLKDIIPAPNED